MMIEKKICFISCINNQQLYREALYYINQLEIPQGYEIECISVEDAESMAQGYNKAMKESDAKYKIYLHQDVYIINKFFIQDILNIFKSNNKLGMLGVAGAKTIPTNAIWWEASNKYGKVYDNHTGQMELLSFNEVSNDYETVQALDGLIVATQYDIPWREDIFDGWHFYDISQSVEFKKAGYEVAVPKQEQPWVVHDCGVVNVRNGYDDYREVFLDEYSKDLFPLVSILIPTYNRPEYFKLALESALNQTYRNIEIIICDDSTNNYTETVVQDYIRISNRIKYIKNPHRLGKGTGLENAQKCFHLSSGEYINFLMDDDLFHPDKISKMMQYYFEFDNISLVTSYRQPIDAKGNNLKPIEATKKLCDKNTFLDGRELGKYIITNMLNVIGEPTTVLFRKKDLDSIFGEYFGRQYYPLSDVSTWLQLMKKGNTVYISEPLSYFRIHGDQNANDTRNMVNGAVEWFYLIKDSYDNTNYVENLHSLHSILNVWLDKSRIVMQRLKQMIFDKKFTYQNRKLINELYKCYEEVLSILLLGSIQQSDILNEQPLVSVIIPAYNHEKYIINTLESIVNQTYNNIELIVLNDGSSDKTHEVISSYEETLNKRFKRYIYINKENEGVCKTFNKGLEIAKGKYIIPFASDDYMFPERIKMQVSFLEKNTDYGMVYTDGFDYNSHDLLGSHCKYEIQNLFSKKMVFVEGDIFEYLLENVFLFPTPTACIRKTCYEQVGFYDENLLYEDPDMFLRIAQKFKIGCINKVLTIHRIHGENAGKNPGTLIAGMILMEEKWSKVHFINTSQKKVLLGYLYRLKAFDYSLGKAFFGEGNYKKANFHFEIAIQGVDKLLEYTTNTNALLEIKSANYIKDLVRCYTLSLINAGKMREAYNTFNKYTQLLDGCIEIKQIVYEAYEKIKNQKIKVIFLTQLPSIWLSTQSVWKAFKEDDRCEVQIIQLPFYHHNYDQKNNENIGEYLEQQNIPFKYWYEYSLQEESPDVVFFQNPYDSTRPPEYSFENVSKLVSKTVYIHYALEISGGGILDFNFRLPIHIKAWRIFVRSEKYKDMFRKYCPSKDSHVLVTGHPKMDAVFCLDETEINKDYEKVIGNRKVILWNPHHCIQKNEWSTFIEWKETLLNAFQKKEDVVLMVRPHPLLFENLKHFSGGNKLVEKFIKKVNSMENVILDLTDNYLQAFKYSDALISDASSLILEYLPTKKPIMYLPKINGGGLNDDGDELVKYLYQGLEEDDLWNFIDNISKGKDPMKSERVSQIEKFLFKFDGKTGYRIKENIISTILSEEI